PAPLHRRASQRRGGGRGGRRIQRGVHAARTGGGDAGADGIYGRWLVDGSGSAGAAFGALTGRALYFTVGPSVRSSITKRSRAGICTAGSVSAFMTASSPTIPLRWSRYAITA